MVLISCHAASPPLIFISASLGSIRKGNLLSSSVGQITVSGFKSHNGDRDPNSGSALSVAISILRRVIKLPDPGWSTCSLGCIGTVRCSRGVVPWGSEGCCSHLAVSSVTVWL